MTKSMFAINVNQKLQIKSCADETIAKICFGHALPYSLYSLNFKANNSVGNATRMERLGQRGQGQGLESVGLVA